MDNQPPFTPRFHRVLRQFLRTFACSVFCSGIACAVPDISYGDSGPSGEWRPLLDSQLSQWEKFLGVPHETVNIPGTAPSDSPDGKHGTPLGLGNDPLGVFTVEEEEHTPVLHISGQIFGCITTIESFENYHFRCQFRWGSRKWAPRMKALRDSGILIHATGEHGAFWNAWKSSLECQIQEGDCGDFFPLGGANADVLLKPDSTTRIYDPAGIFCKKGKPVKHGPSEEKLPGEWNTIDILAVGRTVLFVVNGTPNMALFNTSKAGAALKAGQIQIQSEGAEVFYKNIEIKPIEDFPSQWKALATHPKGEPMAFPMP